MFKPGDKVTAATYQKAAAWCNERNHYTIEDYTIVEIPPKTEAQRRLKFVRCAIGCWQRQTGICCRIIR